MSSNISEMQRFTPPCTSTKSNQGFVCSIVCNDPVSDSEVIDFYCVDMQAVYAYALFTAYGAFYNAV